MKSLTITPLIVCIVCILQATSTVADVTLKQNVTVSAGGTMSMMNKGVSVVVRND